MNAISAQYTLMTLLDTASGICSPGSRAGLTPAASPDIPMTPTSSPAPRLASRSASPDDRQALRTTVISGRKWLGLLHRSDPLLSLSRTLLTSSAWRSTECSLIWRARATAHGRLLFQLVPSMRRTDATGCGLPPKPWATPQARDGMPRGSQGKRFLNPERSNDLPDEVAMVADLWSTPRASDGAKGGPNMAFGAGGQPLPAQAAQALWPTPTTPSGGQTVPEGTSATCRRPDGSKATVTLANVAAQALWPTPQASDGSGGGQAKRATNPERSNDLNDFAVLMAASGTAPDGSPGRTEKPAGSLNPEFVCWLLGFPPEWLSSAPSEMPSARRRPPKSSKP